MDVQCKVGVACLVDVLWIHGNIIARSDGVQCAVDACQCVVVCQADDICSFCICAVQCNGRQPAVKDVGVSSRPSRSASCR